MTADASAVGLEEQEANFVAPPRNSAAPSPVALSRIGLDISLARWLLFAQRSGSIPMPFLIILVFWLTVIFVGFGLLAPRDGTALATLFICAVSLAGAVFLILELDRPFEGLLRVSVAPLSDALGQLGR
jgi:hypothetical protein